MSDLLHAFGIDWHLLIAQTVNFAIVLVALSYFLYKPILRTLERRREIVAKGVEDARLAGEKLAHADEEAGKKVSLADAKAGEILQTARKEAGTEKAELIAAAEARAAQIAKDAEAHALEARERARRESEKEIARLAVLAAEKVLKSK